MSDGRPIAEREAGRLWTVQDYFELYAFGHIHPLIFAEYRARTPMFDHFLQRKASKLRALAERIKGEQEDDGA